MGRRRLLRCTPARASIAGLPVFSSGARVGVASGRIDIPCGVLAHRCLSPPSVGQDPGVHVRAGYRSWWGHSRRGSSAVTSPWLTILFAAGATARALATPLTASGVTPATGGLATRPSYPHTQGIVLQTLPAVVGGADFAASVGGVVVARRHGAPFPVGHLVVGGGRSGRGR